MATSLRLFSSLTEEVGPSSLVVVLFWARKGEEVKDYEKPIVVDYGDLKELTAAELKGNNTDVDKGGFVPNILTCDPSSPIPCVSLP
jgi:hypothetical protein